MPNWIEDCKAKYEKTKSEKEYVECLLERIRIQSRKQRLQEHGVRALFELTKERGCGVLAPIHDLRKQSGISSKQSQTCGLWGWVDAGVVDCFYKINENFYQAVEQVLGNRA